MREVLFIDRHPLEYKVSDGQPSFDPVVPLSISHHRPEAIDISKLRSTSIIYDTCFNGDLITSPQLLEDFYLLECMRPGASFEFDDRFKYLHPGREYKINTPGVGESESLQSYRAKLWLFSNVEGFENQPYPINLDQGVIVQDKRTRHILGRNALHRTGIRVEINYHAETPSLSLWVPEWRKLT